MRIIPIAMAGVVWGGLLAATASSQPILNRVEKFLRDQVEAAGQSSQPPEPGYLGLIAEDTPGAGSGARVLKVVDDHAAAKAGLRAGDRITKIDDRPVRTMDDLAAALAGKTAGTKLAFTVARNGKEQTLDVTLGSRSAVAVGAPENLPAPAKAAEAGTGTPRFRLGVRSVPVSDAVRRQNNLSSARGAQVVSVVVDSPAQRAGIPLGAVITAVDETAINTPLELAAAVRDAKTNEIEVTYVERGQPIRKKVTLGAPVAASETAQPQVRARPPLPDFPAPSEIAAPVVENPTLEKDQRVEKLERRVQELEARVESLEAELAKHQVPPGEN